jgi:hypothetical protein
MRHGAKPSAWAGAILVAALILPSCADGVGEDLDEPPPVTIRYGDESIELDAWAYCFGNVCADGDPPASLPDVGDPEEIGVEFPVPEWSFTATFVPAADECERAERVRLKASGEGRFVLRPVGRSDTYEVTLFGRGDGDLIVTFRWTTPRDGPPGDLRSVTQPCQSGTS